MLDQPLVWVSTDLLVQLATTILQRRAERCEALLALSVVNNLPKNERRHIRQEAKLERTECKLSKPPEFRQTTAVCICLLLAELETAEMRQQKSTSHTQPSLTIVRWICVELFV